MAREIHMPCSVGASSFASEENRSVLDMWRDKEKASIESNWVLLGSAAPRP